MDLLTIWKKNECIYVHFLINRFCSGVNNFFWIAFFFRTRTKKGPFKIEGPFAISVGVADLKQSSYHFEFQYFTLPI